MSVLMASLLLALTVAASIAVVAGEFSGQIQLYRDTSYRYNLVLFAFTKSNRCFNLACNDYNDAVSSVDWSGLPTTASYDGVTKAHIVFYTDTDCTGQNKQFPTSWGKVPSFVDYDMNDAISSFMVLETSKEIENGKINLCSLESTTLAADLNATAGIDTQTSNNVSSS
ncbi:hypothetical protein PF005_g17876 [Phytophthora fragariae]|uniref:Thioredoxin domain-containing protein n=2 Tax=Phytophthora TaxID=4783 RepID=A0A6A3X2N5_9STRA|nr:hypothetical protein PF003_g17046 [Phytophthora fragariae]KAE9037253.1 hypothetical protein PR002_g6668 [Phytophthora rubi]KAE8929796.1 hypothetical protein PF009_g20099 [Phytophthora fragariae]KAE8988806.1 hypothetical protein PF011_g19022 [Phytophthora fragariae]KAE9042127.1 hypothetical protein PR001_g6321 [Phytophthora rubi]